MNDINCDSKVFKKIALAMEFRTVVFVYNTTSSIDYFLITHLFYS